MDEQKRQRWRRASVGELQQALGRGDLTAAEFQELYRERKPAGSPVRTVLLITAALFGLGILIFCGGCGLILMKPWQ